MARGVRRSEDTPNRALPWFRRLVGRTGFSPRLVRVGVLVDKVATETGFAPNTSFFRPSVSFYQFSIFIHSLITDIYKLSSLERR
jgi:hypothetical protein